VTKIKIMHVVWSLGTGGTELMLRKVIQGLADDRFEHVICTLRGDQRLEDERVRVVCLDKQSGKSAFLVPKLVRIIRAEKPAVVHSRNWSGIEAVMAAKIARVPFIVHSEHGRDLNELKGQPWRRRFFRHLCYRSADVIFTVSAELKSYYATQAAINPGRIRVLYNGVDTERFRPMPVARAQKRKELGFTEDEYVVGTLGRFDPVKNHRLLIEAVKICASRGTRLKLLLIGTGTESQRKEIENQIRKSPLLERNAILLGEVKDTAEWLNALDVFVLPSVTEGLSNTLLEAMAVGVPAIASRVGGNPEVVKDGVSGYLFDPADPNTLSLLIDRLHSDLALRNTMSTNARSDIQSRFEFGKMVNQYSRLYSGIEAGQTAEVPSELGVRQAN